MLFGGHKAVVRPVPIPNSAVKHSLADGSGFIDSARVGCRQFFLKAESSKRSFGFFSSLHPWLLIDPAHPFIPAKCLCVGRPCKAGSVVFKLRSLTAKVV